MDIQDFKTARFNVVGFGSKVKGEMHLNGRSSLSGEFEGDIIALEGADLIIEKTANVQGSIKAHNVEIHGHFQGSIEASGTLSIRPGSQVTGQLRAQRLVIYPGAHVNSETAAG